MRSYNRLKREQINTVGELTEESGQTCSTSQLRPGRSTRSAAKLAQRGAFAGDQPPGFDPAPQ